MPGTECLLQAGLPTCCAARCRIDRTEATRLAQVREAASALLAHEVIDWCRMRTDVAELRARRVAARKGPDLAAAAARSARDPRGSARTHTRFDPDSRSLSQGVLTADEWSRIPRCNRSNGTST